MIRLFLSLCCTVSLSFGLCPLLPDVVSLDVDAFADLARDLDAEVEKIVDPAKPGVSIGLVYNQSLIFSKGYGKINVTDPGLGSPTDRTGFRIGSLTKIFTVIWLLQQRDANKLDIDDPVAKYLPNFKINNPFRSRRDVTLRQLACHMGGLAREVPCSGTYDVAGCRLSFDEIYDNIANSSLVYPPGRMPSYSNMGFALLGRALEAHMKTSWEDWIYEGIAKPMNMSNTGARFTPSTVKNLAVGYIDDKEAGLVDMGWEAPAGQMYSSVDDLSKLLMMIFRDRLEYGGVAGQILDGETLREWMEPTYMNVDGTGFGLPWELYPIGKPVANYTVRTKSGAINGYRARFYFLHEIKTGFVFLQASEDSVQESRLSDLLVEFLFRVEGVLWRHQTGPNISDHPEDYTGNFTLGMEQETAISIKIISLNAMKFLRGLWDDGRQFDLIYSSRDVFMMTLRYVAHSCDTENDGDQQLVYFARSPKTNHVTSFRIPGWDYDATYNLKKPAD